MLTDLLAFLRERAARPDVGAEGATDLLAFIRERATRPGEINEGAELLTALEERLSRELAAAGGARAPAATPGDLTRRRE